MHHYYNPVAGERKFRLSLQLDQSMALQEPQARSSLQDLPQGQSLQQEQ